MRMDDLLTFADAQERFRHIIAAWQIEQEELVQKAFHMAQTQFIVSYEQLSDHFALKQPSMQLAVSKVAVVPIGERFVVKAISNHFERADLQQLEQSLRRWIGQREWHLYANCTQVYRFYMAFIRQLYSKKAAWHIVTDVTRKMMKVNQKSLQLKQLHLLYIVYLFSIESDYVQREMKMFDRRWSAGKWALHEKEQVLLHYMRMHVAARRKRWQKVKRHAERLLQDDWLASFAVELTVDIGMLLPSYSTDANMFMKSFKNHYVAYTCYLYVMALSELNNNEGIVQFVKAEPVASCTMLYTYMQTRDPDDLVRVETVVQQNIAELVDGHHRHVGASIQRWQEVRVDMDDWIITLSEHVCRLIKACFIMGELAVFEKLMTIYMKYLYVEHHFVRLKESLKSNIEYNHLVEMQ